jgi:photosystem II stability/assembly factor-like uncharacterized protein
MTQPVWNRSIIAPGGTVIAGALDHTGTPLAATPAGIFHRDGGAWLPLPDQPAIPFPQAFAAADRSLLLGGGEVILFSADNGATWKRGQTLALEQPITCLAAAPNFAESRVVLAGTDGAGVLRSTDGGRIWQYASFGLQDFCITALAAAPCWGDREVVFAATPSGLYRSPNGGRAWKSANCGLEGRVVLSLAIMGSMDSLIVFAGTEAHGIYRSTDSGSTWHLCPFPNAEPPAINALWNIPGSECLLAGTDDGQIWRSPDAGDTWALCAAIGDSILCFFGDGSCLYAGTADAGLLASDDGGQTWYSDMLTARAFTSLSSSTDDTLFACGAVEGIWQSGDGGAAWQNVGDFEALLLTAAFPDDPRGVRFAAVAQGLLRADASNPEWQPVLPAPDITTIFAQDGRIWVGTWGGDLYISEDGGISWQAFPAPPTHTTIVQLGTNAGNLLATTYKPETQTLTLWRFTEGRWQIWLEAPSAAPTAQIADVGGDTIVSLGTRGFRWTAEQWHGVLKTDKPILRLRRWHDGLLVLTADRLMHSADLADWTTLHTSPDNSLNDFALRLPEAVCLLARGGILLHVPLTQP